MVRIIITPDKRPMTVLYGTLLIPILLLTLTTAHAQIPYKDDASRPWRVWGGVSKYPQRYGGNNWGAELGARWRWVGVSLHVTDLDHPGMVWPNVKDGRAPNGSDAVYFSRLFRGAMLNGYYPATDWLSLYAGGGYFYRPYQWLYRDRVTDEYYEGENSRSSGVATEEGAFGAGLQFSEHALVIGGGYNTTLGITAHIGFRF